MGKNAITRVLLVDDHAVVRAGFKMLLATQDNIQVVGEADRGETAIQQYSQLRPDVIVMDLTMPGIGGLETIKRIIQRDASARILVFSVHDEAVFVNRALSAGAQGYLSKNGAPEILPEAIAAVMQGHVYVEHGLAKESGIHPEKSDYSQIIETFSAREFDVFQLLSKGQSSAEIAEAMCLSNKTVANYATQIRKKLHAKTLREVVQIAMLMESSK